jgi:hypothetical protein
VRISVKNSRIVNNANRIATAAMSETRARLLWLAAHLESTLMLRSAAKRRVSKHEAKVHPRRLFLTARETPDRTSK